MTGAGSINGWLLDTNVLIDLIFARAPVLETRYVAALARGDPLFLSVISVFEFRFGAERSRRRDFQIEALERLSASVGLVEFSDPDARTAARIRADLAAAGTPIGPYDLLIAAQASTRGLAIVTGNVQEFSRVRGLAIDDWTAPAASP